MKGMTYRYYNGPVQYPFGFGLSYASFAYSWAAGPGRVRSLQDTLVFSVNVKNTGAMGSDEVAQVYIQYPGIGRMPLKELKSFKRIYIEKNGMQTLQFRIPVAELQKWDIAQRRWRLYPGDYSILVGGDSRDAQLRATFNVKPGVQ